MTEKRRRENRVVARYWTIVRRLDEEIDRRMDEYRKSGSSLYMRWEALAKADAAAARKARITGWRRGR